LASSEADAEQRSGRAQSLVAPIRGGAKFCLASSEADAEQRSGRAQSLVAPIRGGA
jgi:hypothetical protein